MADLRRDSPEFRALWADQTVRGLTRMFKVIQHPEAGRIELTYQTFDVRDALGQQLLVGTPEPGSRSAESLAALADLSATDRAIAGRPPLGGQPREEAFDGSAGERRP